MSFDTPCQIHLQKELPHYKKSFLTAELNMESGSDSYCISVLVSYSSAILIFLNENL